METLSELKEGVETAPAFSFESSPAGNGVPDGQSGLCDFHPVSGLMDDLNRRDLRPRGFCRRFGDSIQASAGPVTGILGKIYHLRPDNGIGRYNTSFQSMEFIRAAISAGAVSISPAMGGCETCSRQISRVMVAMHYGRWKTIRCKV